MATKKNNNLVEVNIACPSQLDMGGVIKDVHDFPGHSLRTRDAMSVVPVHYTHFDATYNLNGQPTKVIYYAGTVNEISQVATKPANILNDKYFFLFAGRSNKSFYIWFNVDSLGTDPAVVNSTGIEIPLNSADPAIVVAMAIELTLNNNPLYNDKWRVSRKNAVVTIKALKSGETTDTLDGDTTFVFSTLQQGEQCEVARVDIDYSNSGDPIYEGQILKGHSFNIFTGKFDKNEVEVTLTTEQGTSILQYSEANGIAKGATAIMLTYVVPASTVAKLKRINIFGDCMGTYTIKVNGNIIDKTGTYYTHYKDTLVFDDIETVAGDTITIEVTNRGTGTGNFNSNLQGRLLDV
jgi:hypothetical protein